MEEFERVEEGWTGPRERRERAKSGSEASRLMAVEMVLAWCWKDELRMESGCNIGGWGSW